RNALERVDAIDVDDQLGLRQPHVQDRHQALAAGQDAGVVAVLGQELEHPLEAVRTDIAEPRGLHAHSLICELPIDVLPSLRNEGKSAAACNACAQGWRGKRAASAAT